mgnify:CR=1 FL=1
MKNTTNYNDIKRFCVLNRITLKEFSERAHIQYDRAHRLAHSRNLLNDLRVSEMQRITDAFPSFLINY